MRTIYLTTLILLLLSGIVLADLGRAEKLELFKKANDSFHKANSITDDTKLRNKAYDDAVIYYQSIITNGPVRNAKLYYNLANAYLLKGDIARAILNYRRAQRLDVSDSDIVKNLAYARSNRLDKFDTPTQQKVLETLFFWHYDFSVQTRFTIAVISLFLFCCCLSVLIIKGKRSAVLIPLFIFLIIAIIAFTSVVITQRTLSSDKPGVIIADQVQAYQGDGISYPPAFDRPLHSGTEFELIEARNNWYHIKLPDSSDCWIKLSSAELI